VLVTLHKAGMKHLWETKYMKRINNYNNSANDTTITSETEEKRVMDKLLKWAGTIK
jgi:hypothetical protein